MFIDVSFYKQKKKRKKRNRKGFFFSYSFSYFVIGGCGCMMFYFFYISSDFTFFLYSFLQIKLSLKKDLIFQFFVLVFLATPTIVNVWMFVTQFLLGQLFNNRSNNNTFQSIYRYVHSVLNICMQRYIVFNIGLYFVNRTQLIVHHSC